MTKLSSNVLAFAAGDVDMLTLIESYKDYWNQVRSEAGTKKYEFSTGKTLKEKEALINQAILREIGKRAGVDFASTPLENVITHPMVNYAAGLIASNLIESILPDTVIDSVGFYSEVRNLGWGESSLFDITPRDLFPVSKAGNFGMRTAEIHKQYNGQVSLIPEMRELTVGVSLYRVLCGLESLAVLSMKAMRSIETEMAKDAYTAFGAAMANLSTTASTGLRVNGYTQQDLVKLAQKVSAFSGGARPMVLGTKVALSQVLPDDANYRYMLTDPAVTVGYIRTISGIDTMELNQFADWTNPFATLVDDTKLYVIAPGTDKIVKIVIGGNTVTNVEQHFDNASLNSTFTIFKAWKSAVITSSVAGIIQL
jgi:hypothetical protein